MKSNRKFRDDDSGVATVVSTILLIAIIVPMMTMIMMTFATMTQKQIEMMDTTVAIMDQFISQIKDRNGYNVTTGVGVLNLTQYTFYKFEGKETYECYVILYKNDENDNLSAFYPVENLSTSFPELMADMDYGKNVNVSFRVRSIITYFSKYIPSVVYVSYDTDNDPFTPDVVKEVRVTLVEVIDISKRLGNTLTTLDL